MKICKKASNKINNYEKRKEIKDYMSVHGICPACGSERISFTLFWVTRYVCKDCEFAVNNDYPYNIINKGKGK